MAMSSFSALQLICHLPNNILSDTIVSEYNTTAGLNGEMAEGEVIRYVSYLRVFVYKKISLSKSNLCT